LAAQAAVIVAFIVNLPQIVNRRVNEVVTLPILILAYYNLVVNSYR